MKASSIVFLILILTSINLRSQNIPVKENSYCVSDIDNNLYNEINKYRESRGLSRIELSQSLCYTAYLHVFDLYHNWLEGTDCNMHSWSGKIGGQAFCYPKDQDERRRKSVWNKAREITGFPGVAYELIYKDDLLQRDIMIALDMWSSTVAGRDYLLNEDKWKDKEWKSIGVAVYNNYVSVLLSDVRDPKGKPMLCSNKKDISMSKNDDITPNDKPVVESNTANATDKKAVPGEPKTYQQQPGIFYIVGTSTEDFNYAKKRLDYFISQGYNSAKIIKNGSKYRVTMSECNTQDKANIEKVRCSKTVKDCWILK